MFNYLTIQYCSEQKLFSETFQSYCQCSIDNNHMQLGKSRLVYWEENCRQQLYINTHVVWRFKKKNKLINVWKKASLSMKVKVKPSHSCPTLCDPMDYTVHGILQGRILEWVAIPFSRVSSQPRDLTQVSLIAGGFFTI